jgi:ABC-type branched-subunit amino acid transport system substrate-binding protein
LVFLNANQALGGREVDLFTLDLDDSGPDFLNRLALLLDNKKPHLIVGGAANSRPVVTANFFQRRGLGWYGPWSNNPDIKTQSDNNPTLILPTEDQELTALMDHVKKVLGAGDVHFVYLEGNSATQTVTRAQSAAQKAGLTLVPLSVSDGFRNWKTLLQPLSQARAIFLWLPPGQATAIVRTLKPTLGKKTLWLTSGLNPPSQELTIMTGGHWAETIFPAVLKPQATIEDSYKHVIRKYGLPGLSLDYQTYLGFAQGQILARAIYNQGQDSLSNALSKITTSDTLLTGTSSTNDLNLFYLAISDRKSGWRPVN